LSTKMYRAMNEVDAGRDCATVFLSGVLWGFLVMLLCFFVKRCSSGCSWSFIVVVYCFLNKSFMRTTAAQSPPIILRDIPLVLCVHLQQVIRDLYQLPRIVVKWVGRCGRAYVTWGRVAPCMRKRFFAYIRFFAYMGLGFARAEP
jgi:hypothetical protein